MSPGPTVPLPRVRPFLFFVAAPVSPRKVRRCAEPDGARPAR